MEEPIAEAHFIGIDSYYQEFEIGAFVGKPFLNSEGVWSCPAKLIGIYGCPENIYGENSLQALCLATGFLYKMILTFIQSGGRIKDADGQAEQYVGAVFGIYTLP